MYSPVLVQSFRSGNFDLANDKLKAIVEMDPSQTSGELASRFGVSIKTILILLDQIGKIKKLEKWVPHELNEHQKRSPL